jgi:hypothetical protein
MTYSFLAELRAMQIRREFIHLDELRLLRNYTSGELRQQLDEEIERLERSLSLHPQGEGKATSAICEIPASENRRIGLGQSSRNCDISVG